MMAAAPLRQKQRTLMFLRTVQCSALRNLFESLRDVLIECCLVFDETSVRCLQIDNRNCVIVSLRLNASSFEKYECTHGPVHVGLNLTNISRLIRGLGQSDALSMEITEENPHILVIHVQSVDRRIDTTYNVSLLDLEPCHVQIPVTTFDTVLSMSSMELQRICRDLASLSDTINVSIVNKELEFNARGDFAEQTTRIGERDGGLSFTKGPVDGFYGSYPLRYIVMFAKSSVLCNSVDMYMQPDYPLLLSYSVASLGRLLFCVTKRANGSVPSTIGISSSSPSSSLQASSAKRPHVVTADAVRKHPTRRRSLDDEEEEEKHEDEDEDEDAELS